MENNELCKNCNHPAHCEKVCPENTCDHCPQCLCRNCIEEEPDSI